MIASIFLNIFLWYLQILQSWTWQCNIAGLQKHSIVGWFKSVNLISEFQSLEWSYSLLLVIAISLSGFWLTIYQSWARNSCLVLHWTCAKVAYLSFNWKRMLYNISSIVHSLIFNTCLELSFPKLYFSVFALWRASSIKYEEFIQHNHLPRPHCDWLIAKTWLHFQW